ncbi:serine hydrolase [Actinoplanes sp. NPDC051513]|uniref:serine hydrolase n=1 Tax=Actinoplanes sp. NPDC051513 TaxID=3363908 RepID=UPI00378B7A94
MLAEVRDTRWAWQGSSGVAELGNTRRVPVNGRFRAGSVTKSFVAAAVLGLVGSAASRWTTRSNDGCPGTVPAGDRITVHHLLQHTSGIVNTWWG